MTKLAGVSRATYYRFDPEAATAVRDVELRDRMQRIAFQFPAYGVSRQGTSPLETFVEMLKRGETIYSPTEAITAAARR